MDYLVIIILAFLVVAGSAAIIWLKLSRRQQAGGTEEGKPHNSSRLTIQQKLSVPDASDSAQDRQSDTAIAGPSSIPPLPSETDLSPRPASPDSSPNEMPSSTPQRAELQSAKSDVDGAEAACTKVWLSGEAVASLDSSDNTSSQQEAPSSKPCAAAAEPDQIIPATEQVSAADLEDVVAKEEDATRLTQPDAPNAEAIEGASQASTLPKAEAGSVAPGSAPTADRSNDALDSTPSSECEEAPEAEHVSEHAGEAGIAADDVVPERIREPELDGPAVAGTHDLCAKPECEIGESQTADIHGEVDVTAAPQAVSVAHQEELRHGPPVADTSAEKSGNSGLVELRTAELAEPPEKPEGPRTPQVYRPTPRTPSQTRNSRPTNGSAKASRSRAMRVEVRVLYEKGGFCRVTLLPQRDGSFPDEIDVEGDGNPPALLALQDEWFQDVSIDGLGEVLERGLVWQGTVKELGTVRWNLSGRDVFVLGRRNDLSGYITIPRLLMGEEHAVLCTETRLPSVLEALRAADSPEPAILRADLGAPLGWIVLKGVTPKSPVASSGEGDILDSLRPLADVEIALLDGIRLSRTTWLAGYPPRIHVRGNADEIGDVLIDGRPAVCSADSAYEAEGWDAIGTHEVWCPNATKTYTIQEGPEHWDTWEAYDWSLGEPTGMGSAVSATICGMFVFPHDEHTSKHKAVTVPATNCVLIGSNPGEIHVCRTRADLRASKLVAFPWFTPVWALPLNPLHCDKRVIRIISLKSTKNAAPSSALAARGRTRAVMAWCSAILDASRKGLVVEPPENVVEKLWREYRQVARAIWRGRR